MSRKGISTNSILSLFNFNQFVSVNIQRVSVCLDFFKLDWRKSLQMRQSNILAFHTCSPETPTPSAYGSESFFFFLDAMKLLPQKSFGKQKDKKKTPANKRCPLWYTGPCQKVSINMSHNTKATCTRYGIKVLWTVSMQEQNIGGISNRLPRQDGTGQSSRVSVWKHDKSIERVCSQHIPTAHRRFLSTKAESHVKSCSTVPVLSLQRWKKIKAASKESYFVLAG